MDRASSLRADPCLWRLVFLIENDFQKGGIGMWSKILVATDGSDHARKAIEFASDMALKYDATIYLIHVVQAPRISEKEFFKIENVLNLLQKNGKEVVEMANREVRMRGVKHLQWTSALGDPATEILRYGNENGVDMIVMGSRGLGAIKGMFLGSVSHKVSHLAECTCITVK
jgi:nucleotide-binding universal stress UspA family protein